MRNFLFALKRWLRQPGFVLILLLSAAAVFLTSLPWAAGRITPAGVCDLEKSTQSRRVTDFLLDNGFREFDDAAAMEEAVARGELDCCVVLPDGLSARIASGEMEGAVRFVSSPTSFTPGLYRSLAASALFKERAPYVTAQALAQSGITGEQVLERYFSMFETGLSFSFEVRSASGAASSEGPGSASLVMCAVSLLLMALLISGAGELTNQNTCAICGRIGLTPWLYRVLLPGLLARAVPAAAAVSAALLAAGFHGCTRAFSLILPAWIYCLLMSAFAVFLLAVLPKARHLSVVLPLLIVASLAFCPVFVDLSMFSSVLAAVRLLLPGYWFWLIAENPVPWLLSAALALPAALLLFSLRCRFVEKLKPGKPM